VPGEALVTNTSTPSYTDHIESYSSHVQEIPWTYSEIPPAISQVENGPHVAWWRSLLAFPGSKKVKRPKDKKHDSKHTAWAKFVCPAKGSRKAAHSQGKSKCLKKNHGMAQGVQDCLPDPGISLFDIHRVILRGSELEKEEKRKVEMQMQRRKRTDKVCEMQAVQIALRQKHDARLKNKSLCKSKDASSNNACKSAELAGQSMNCVGYLYSLREQQVIENSVPLEGNQELLLSQNDSQDDLKDGQASSTSAETDGEASSVSDILQDTDDESYSLV